LSLEPNQRFYQIKINPWTRTRGFIKLKKILELKLEVLPNWFFPILERKIETKIKDFLKKWEPANIGSHLRLTYLDGSLNIEKNLGLKSHSHELKVFINNLAYTNLFSIALSILKVKLWLFYYQQQFVDTCVHHFLLNFFN
jgi:hypothetical protein